MRIVTLGARPAPRNEECHVAPEPVLNLDEGVELLVEAPILFRVPRETLLLLHNLDILHLDPLLGQTVQVNRALRRGPVGEKKESCNGGENIAWAVVSCVDGRGRGHRLDATRLKRRAFIQKVEK